jgi:DNA-binding NarL/FixJ family response regulator
MASTGKIRLLIADDHPIMRDTLLSILKQYAEIEIVGEATNGEDAVVKAEELQPAIVLMDINMPRLDGIQATQRINANSSQIAVIGLSVGEQRTLDAMFRAGAVAVVLKERAAEDLYDAIQRAFALSFLSCPSSTVVSQVEDDHPCFSLDYSPQTSGIGATDGGMERRGSIVS